MKYQGKIGKYKEKYYGTTEDQWFEEGGHQRRKMRNFNFEKKDQKNGKI